MGCCASYEQFDRLRLHSCTERILQSSTPQLSDTDSSVPGNKVASPGKRKSPLAMSTNSKPAPSTSETPLASPEAASSTSPKPGSERPCGENSVNSQPPLAHLFEKGFITPLSIQFTRNHGSVPQLRWNEHRLYIRGLVEKPIFFTMDQLASMHTVTIPVSITSASNRGKELNMLKPTSGLNWGAAATACSFWTGVRLSDLLRISRIDATRAKYVHFRASERENLPNGIYCSSVDIETALNPFSNVLVAYKQNGEHLRGGNGFPIRIIVPGWIGARMVKWLSVIDLSDEPLDNYYYRYENRLFPSFVDRTLAHKQKYWNQDQYVFNELNINSVIAHPCHQHKLQIDEKSSFEIKGYAYSGGGRKITRVELSFDGGHSWNECRLNYPEEKFTRIARYGKYYCWMFWSFQVQNSGFIGAMKRSGELRCRAWDQSNNMQPREMNWNMLGCGNNAQYIVKTKFITGSEIDTEEKEATKSVSHIKFLHPTVAGGNQGGWMEIRSYGAIQVSANAKEANQTDFKRFSPKEEEGMNDVEQENNASTHAEWTSRSKKRDATLHLGIHALTGLNIPGDRVDGPIPEYKVLTKGAASTEAHRRVANEPVRALDPTAWLSFELVEKKTISFDTRLFKFRLPSKNHYLGVPVGQHVLVRTMINGNPLIRAYTPVSSEKQLGYFTLCVKVYFAAGDLQNPEGGKMSQFMECLLVGDMMSITGPCGEVHYKGHGIVSFQQREKRYRKIGLICGGTGITPAFQVMHNIYQNVSDSTEIFLLYANRTQYDILLQPDLDLMAEKRENIHVWYTLEKITGLWMYSKGLVTEQMIRDRTPSPTDDTLILLCGPPDMISSCLSSLARIGHTKENIMQF
ncbi:nitrate reductase [Gracilaria domingensis]|nr:nitrate reductase [Gracilaria domingensis]